MFNYPYQPYLNQQPSSGIIWIQGEAAAKSYLVAPNSTVPLWDSERQTIYIKSADAAGMPSLKIIDYTIRDTQQGAAAPAYATREDLDAVKTQIAALKDEWEKARKEQ